MNCFALADCNNFYVSCERSFQPNLEGKPVMVLSNNDGCVVARSNEVKQLGISMGVPFWQVKDLVRQHQIKVFSSNYQLYGNLSARVMSILAEDCSDLEVYSIDEAFMQLQEKDFSKLLERGQLLRQTVRQCTGIPICIGYAPTKTLAKLANHIAKKHTDTGVFSLMNWQEEEALLQKIGIQELWGIGPAYTRKLHNFGIKSVWQLMQCSETWFRKEFTVQGLRLLKELKGEACFGLESPVEQRQNMVVSRSFRKDLVALSELKEQLAAHAFRMGEKLRRYGQVARGISVFLMPNRYRANQKHLKGYFSCSGQLAMASSNSADLIALAGRLAEKIYQPNIAYKKAGVMAWELSTADCLQSNLFMSSEAQFKKQKTMQVLDQLNARFGKGTISLAACPLSKKSRALHSSEALDIRVVGRNC